MDTGKLRSLNIMRCNALWFSGNIPTVVSADAIYILTVFPRKENYETCFFLNKQKVSTSRYTYGGFIIIHWIWF